MQVLALVLLTDAVECSGHWKLTCAPGQYLHPVYVAVGHMTFSSPVPIQENPTGQSSHAESPASEVLPAGHAEHEVSPGEAYSPAPQHTAAPAYELFPAGQDVQIAKSPCAYVVLDEPW